MLKKVREKIYCDHKRITVLYCIMLLPKQEDIRKCHNVTGFLMSLFFILTSFHVKYTIRVFFSCKL